MSIDIIMTVLLLFQMAYMLVGNTLHEWAGAAMLVLFISHNILNVKWYRNLFKGKYSEFRILQTVVNLALLLCMLSLMISGMMMSRVVFSFFSIEGGMGFARLLHMAAAYWGFFLMSAHLGQWLWVWCERCGSGKTHQGYGRGCCGFWRQRSADSVSVPL